MDQTKTNTPEEITAKPRGISLYDQDYRDLKRWAQREQKARQRGRVSISEIVQELIEKKRQEEKGK